MNKLSALSKLASAYHDQRAQYVSKVAVASETIAEVATSSLVDTVDALFILSDKFGYIRRSLRLEDLTPQPKAPVEGLNGPMPTHF